MIATETRFKYGDRVLDLYGNRGIVVQVNTLEWHVWYDVSFSPGTSEPCYDADLMLAGATR